MSLLGDPYRNIIRQGGGDAPNSHRVGFPISVFIFHFRIEFQPVGGS